MVYSILSVLSKETEIDKDSWGVLIVAAIAHDVGTEFLTNFLKIALVKRIFFTLENSIQIPFEIIRDYPMDFWQNRQMLYAPYTVKSPPSNFTTLPLYAIFFTTEKTIYLLILFKSMYILNNYLLIFF